MNRTTLTRFALAAGLMAAGSDPVFGQTGRPQPVPTQPPAPVTWVRAGTLQSSTSEFTGNPTPVAEPLPESRVIPASAITPVAGTATFMQPPLVGPYLDPTFPVGPGGFVTSGLVVPRPMQSTVPVRMPTTIAAGGSVRPATMLGAKAVIPPSPPKPVPTYKPVRASK